MGTSSRTPFQKHSRSIRWSDEIRRSTISDRTDHKMPFIIARMIDTDDCHSTVVSRLLSLAPVSYRITRPLVGSAVQSSLASTATSRDIKRRYRHQATSHRPVHLIQFCLYTRHPTCVELTLTLHDPPSLASSLLRSATLF